MTPRPRAILLDAGNTLVFLDGGRLADLCAEVGVRLDEIRFPAGELAARATLVDGMPDGSTGLEPGLWRRYFRDVLRGSGVPWWRLPRVARRLRQAGSLVHLWSRVEEGTAQALARLRRDGYRLAVLSNADGTMEELIEQVGLREYFEFVLDSGTVAWEKPDPRIFRDAVARLGVEPADALYAGDLYHVDVLGARAAGMDAVLVDPLNRRSHDVDRIPTVAHLPDYVSGRYL